VASALAGLSVFMPRVRRLARRVALGTAEAAPAAALPFKRPLRSIPRVAWAMAALGLVSAAWTLWLVNYLSNQPGSVAAAPWIFAINLCLLPVVVSVPAVVAWRYPLADRSSRLLLLGTAATLFISLLSLFEATFNLYGVSALAYALEYVYGVLSVTSSVALAAGLARRSGSVRRPPLWLAAAAVGAAFFIQMSFLFDWLFEESDGGVLFGMSPTDLVTWLFAAASNWLELVGLLAIWWVGISAWRRHGGAWAWRLVLMAGTLQLIALLPERLFNLYNGYLVFYTPFGTVGAGDFSTMIALAQWRSLTGAIAVTALVLALLIGLRPVPPKSPPAESSADTPEGDAAAAPASGETPAV
jgi:hypothetical protein